MDWRRGAFALDHARLLDGGGRRGSHDGTAAAAYVGSSDDDNVLEW